MQLQIWSAPSSHPLPPPKEEKEEEKGRHKVTSDEWPTSCEWPFASGSIFMPQNLRALQLTLSACPINVCEHCSSLSLHAPSMSVSTAAHSLCIAHQCLRVLQPLHALSMSVSTAALCMRHQCLWVLQLSACPINVCEYCSSIHAPSMSVSTAALSLCMLHQCLWALHLSLCMPQCLQALQLTACPISVSTATLTACPSVCEHCSSLHAPSMWVLQLCLTACPSVCEHCSSLHAPSMWVLQLCLTACPSVCEHCSSLHAPSMWVLQLCLTACPSVCEHCSSLHAPSMPVSTAAHSASMPQCLWALQLTACPNVCEHCSSLHAPMSVSTAAHCMPQCLWALQLTACPNVCEHCSSLHAPMSVSTAAHCMPQCLQALQLTHPRGSAPCLCPSQRHWTGWWRWRGLLSATVYNPHVKTQSCLWTWPNIHRAASAEVSCALHPVWMGHLSCCTDLVSLSVFSSSLCTAYILYIIYIEYTSFFITPHPTHTHLSSCHDLNKWKAKRHIPPPKKNKKTTMPTPTQEAKWKGGSLATAGQMLPWCSCWSRTPAPSAHLWPWRTTGTSASGPQCGSRPAADPDLKPPRTVCNLTGHYSHCHSGNRPYTHSKLWCAQTE